LVKLYKQKPIASNEMEKKNKRIGKSLIELLKVKVLISGKQIMGFSLTVSHAPGFHGYTRNVKERALISQSGDPSEVISFAIP